MPKGISESFLRLLESEHPRALRALAGAAALALLGLVVADLSDAPRLGRDSMTYAVMVLVGAALGAFSARAAAHRLLSRLSDRWAHTMRDAAGVDSVAALDRRVRGKGPVARWIAPAVAVAFTVANVLLLALLWADDPAAPTVSLMVLTADGLAVGAWAGASAYRLLFARTFVREVDTLVARGTLGVWGEA